MAKCVLIYGGTGTLGRACVTQFKLRNWWVVSVQARKLTMNEHSDPNKSSVEYITTLVNEDQVKQINEEANANILIHTGVPIRQQEAAIKKYIATFIGELNAIICLAGEYDTSILNNSFTDDCEKMWQRNTWPALLSAKIAAEFLSPDGMLCLSGAKAALEGTPNAIGFGFCKAAVHQLAKSLACPGSGFPEKALCVALLLESVDTVKGKEIFVEASYWAPTDHITDLLLMWSEGKERPKNGSLVQCVTEIKYNTNVSYL